MNQIPVDVINEFTYGNRVAPFYLYRNDNQWMYGKKVVWTIEKVEKLRHDFKNGELSGLYGIHEVQAISRHIDEFMLQKVPTYRNT